MNWNPSRPVFGQSRRTPESLALFADGVELTYADLVRRASRLAAALRKQGIGRGSRVGILGSRSLVSVEAVLGVAWCGATYVPLGLSWPESRLNAALSLVALDAVIADERGLGCITPLLLAETKLVVVPSDSAAHALPTDAGRVVLSVESLPGGDVSEPRVMAGDDLAYIVFTSGTTGVPKGVMVTARSVAAYLSALALRKAMTPDDRASQFTELTFDPSIGEIFVPWRTGASLHVVPSVSQVSPARFIRDRRLTIWGSAPSAIAWMRDTRALQPRSLAGLRYSSFGGEPLTLASVLAWQAAAPNSVVDNLYGPTEATVDCAGQRVPLGVAPVVTPGRGVLAIGTPHPGTELAVLGHDRRALPRGEIGELAIAGDQLALGYLGAPQLTAERFPSIDGKRWYLTGDLAMQDASGVFHCLGRMDNQIKIQGHRVELEEVEAHLREVADCEEVVAIAWPVDSGVAKAVVAFVAGSARPVRHFRDALRRRLPPHAVPSAIHELASLPRNAAGKLDRGKLVARLDAMARGDADPVD